MRDKPESTDSRVVLMVAYEGDTEEARLLTIANDLAATPIALRLDEELHLIVTPVEYGGLVRWTYQAEVKKI